MVGRCAGGILHPASPNALPHIMVKGTIYEESHFFLKGLCMVGRSFVPPTSHHIMLKEMGCESTLRYSLKRGICVDLIPTARRLSKISSTKRKSTVNRLLVLGHQNRTQGRFFLLGVLSLSCKAVEFPYSYDKINDNLSSQQNDLYPKQMLGTSSEECIPI